MDWLFFVWFGPLIVASLVFCGEDSSFRKLTFSSPTPDLTPEERRAFGRFVRSADLVPDAPIAPAVLAWAEGVVKPQPCRWDRYLNWAWFFWITAGVATALAFGSARDIAIHLVVFDVMVLLIAVGQAARRRAFALLAAAGR